MAFNLEKLKATAATTTTTQKLTLADMVGKQAILPLPVGLHECKLVDVPKTLTDTSFRLIVESEGQKYSVSQNIGNTPEQADIFMNIISFLLEQLDMKVLDLEVLGKKIGETVMILASTKTTDRGTFVNYSFNPQTMVNIINQQAAAAATATA